MTKPSARSVPGVPPNLVAVYDKAGGTCGAVSGALLAAQGHQESWSFNPKVIDGEIKSPTGAIGIAQFMPKVWPKWGTGDPRNPTDAIPAQARYDCALAKALGPLGANKTELLLAGYNAGVNAVKKYHGVPPYKETQTYVRRIEALANV